MSIQDNEDRGFVFAGEYIRAGDVVYVSKDDGKAYRCTAESIPEAVAIADVAKGESCHNILGPQIVTHGWTVVIG